MKLDFSSYCNFVGFLPLAVLFAI